MVYAQTRIYPKNGTHEILWDFDIQMDHLIPDKRPDPVLINQKQQQFVFLLILPF